MPFSFPSCYGFSTPMEIKQASRYSVLACSTGMKYTVLVLLHFALSFKACNNQIWKLLFCETLRFPGYTVCDFLPGVLLSETDVLQLPHCQKECLFYLWDTNC